MTLTRRIAALGTAILLAVGLAIVPTATATALGSLEITTTSVGPFIAGQPVSVQLTANDDDVRWRALSLPSGLSVSGTGLLTGTVNAPTYGGLIVLAERGSIFNNYGSDTAFFGVTVKPVVTQALLPAATVDVPYSATISATPAAIRYFTRAGALPPGLSFNVVTGVISGIPSDSLGASNSASYAFSISVNANAIASDAVGFSITLGHQAPVMTAAVLPDATVDVSYTAQLTASGGGTISYSATGLPAGLTLDSATGIISGIPTYQPGYVTASTVVVFSATASNGSPSAPQPLAITVVTPVPSIDTAVLPDAAVDTAYSTVLPHTGHGPLTVALAQGSTLPDGLTFAADGTVSGTPTYHSSYGPSEDFTFTAVVTGPGGTAQATYTLHVTVAEPTIATTTLAEGWLTQGYSQQLSAAGPGVDLTVTGLPDGLSLDGWTIVGTPLEAGSFDVTLTASNGAGSVQSILTLVINAAPAITTGALGHGIVATPYSKQLAATGKDVVFTLGAGAPAGMTITPQGLLEWVPGAQGVTTVTVVATNLSGSDSHQFAITSYVSPAFTTTTLAAGTQGRLYLATIDHTGLHVSVSLASGTLPRGVTLAADGRLSGVPTQFGTFSLEVTATNVAGSATQALTLRIAAPAIAVTASEATPAGIVEPIEASPDAPVTTSASDEELPTLSNPKAAEDEAPAAAADFTGFIIGGILLLLLAIAAAVLLRRRAIKG